jgi:hypothetical protein
VSALTSLQRAERINEEHHAGNAAALNAIEHYYRAGVLLNEQKAETPHGQWLTWLEANFEGDPRTAQRYMRLADNWPTLKAKSDTGVSYSTLSQALGVLTEPREPRGLEGLKVILWGIQLAEELVTVRDHKVFHGDYAAFESYCWERYKLDADLVKNALGLVDPENVPLRDVAMGLMIERNLTFKGAVDHVVNEFQKHVASAA